MDQDVIVESTTAVMLLALDKACGGEGVCGVVLQPLGGLPALLVVTGVECGQLG